MIQHPLINIAVTAARKAGPIILRAFEKVDRLQITEKTTNNFVSEADINAEKTIIDVIQRAHPRHNIIGEESGTIDEGNETTWIIDPLDGTRNFLHQLPHFAISIAVKEKNRIQHGVIYDPIRDELFTASRGNGAKINNKRIRVSQVSTLEQALLGTGYPFIDSCLPEYATLGASIFSKCAGVRCAGAAALDLAYIAAGRLDAYCEMGLKLWDIAAGILMIQEAGGLVSDFEGGETYLATGNVVTGTPKVFKALLMNFHAAAKK